MAAGLRPFPSARANPPNMVGFSASAGQGQQRRCHERPPWPPLPQLQPGFGFGAARIAGYRKLKLGVIDSRSIQHRPVGGSLLLPLPKTCASLSWVLAEDSIAPSRSTIFSNVSWMASNVLEFRSSERRASVSSIFRSSDSPATAAASVVPAMLPIASSNGLFRRVQNGVAIGDKRLFQRINAGF